MAWPILLPMGGLWFRRRDPGWNPGLTGALHLILPGLGHASAPRGDWFLVACVILLGSVILLDRVLGIESRHPLLVTAIGTAAMMFGCLSTARRMARPERGAEEPRMRK